MKLPLHSSLPYHPSSFSSTMALLRRSLRIAALQPSLHTPPSPYPSSPFTLPQDLSPSRIPPSPPAQHPSLLPPCPAPLVPHGSREMERKRAPFKRRKRPFPALGSKRKLNFDHPYSLSLRLHPSDAVLKVDLCPLSVWAQPRRRRPPLRPPVEICEAKNESRKVSCAPCGEKRVVDAQTSKDELRAGSRSVGRANDDDRPTASRKKTKLNSKLGDGMVGKAKRDLCEATVKLEDVSLSSGFGTGDSQRRPDARGGLSDCDEMLFRNAVGGEKHCGAEGRHQEGMSDDAKNHIEGKPSSCVVEERKTAEENNLALVTFAASECRAIDVPPLAQSSITIASALPVRCRGPYPSYTRPTPEECRDARDLLQALHGPLEEYARHRVSCPTRDPEPELLAIEYHPEQNGIVETSIVQEESSPTDVKVRQKAKISGHPRKRDTVLDSLIGTILSQNTTDTNSRRAYASLRRAFPSWEKVLKADPKAVEDAIRCGGLAEIKTSRIHNILDTLMRERGEVCLEYLRDLPIEQIKAELSRFKGVGPKTVACVLMFHLQQDEFPVDTHVFRITKMLGWVPASADREKAYLHLNNCIPDDLKFDLHCLFVTHGKRCPRCSKGGRVQQRVDGPCPLVNWNQRISELAAPNLLEMGTPQGL